MSFVRRRKAASSQNQDPPVQSSQHVEKDDANDDNRNKREEKSPLKKKQQQSQQKQKQREEQKIVKKWNCLDSCCWFIGFICSIWWLLIFLFNAMPASFPQYVTEAITGPLPDPPGVKLAKEGLKAKHPVVFVPGIVTGGLELWEGHQCADGLFRKRLWGGTFGELYKRS